VLIDQYLPKYDERVYHRTRVAGDSSAAFATLRKLDVNRSVIVRLLFATRGLMSRVSWDGRRPGREKAPRSLLDSMLDLGWEVLGETPDREVVAGTVTQPWASTVQFHGLSPSEFVAFAEPGFSKIVMNLAAEDCGEGGAIVSTETRVLGTSPSARRRFRRYWFVVRPGVKLIRRIALDKVRRELRRAEKHRHA
jgi:hypothetical protein